MLLVRTVVLLALLPACLQPTPVNIVGTGSDVGADAATGEQVSDIATHPGLSTEPYVVVSGAVDPLVDTVKPLGFVDDTYLLFGTDVSGSLGQGIGNLSVIDVNTKATHLLGFGRDPFDANTLTTKRPVTASPDGTLWLFGDDTNAYVRNLASPSGPALDLGPTSQGRYAMNAAGTIIVTLFQGTLQVRRTDGSVIRGVGKVSQFLVSSDRQHLFWVTGGHFFADDFDEDAGVVDAAIGPADDARFEELAGGRYVNYALPNGSGDILYDVSARQIAMDTTTAESLKEVARDLAVVDGKALWRTKKTGSRVWVAQLPGGVPQKVPNAVTFAALPHGLLLVSADGKARFQSFEDGSEGPDVSGWGAPAFGALVRSNGAVLMATDKGTGQPKVCSWVDLRAGILQTAPEPTLIKPNPLFLGEDLFVYPDEDDVVSIAALASGGVFKAERLERSKKPVLTDDGRAVVRTSAGLVVLGPDLEPLVLATEPPEFMQTRGDKVAFARTLDGRRELVLMRLPPLAP